MPEVNPFQPKKILSESASLSLSLSVIYFPIKLPIQGGEERALLLLRFLVSPQSSISVFGLQKYMGVKNTSSPCGLLEGLHGVQLVGRSLYRDGEALHCGEFDVSTCEGSEAVGINQRLLVRRLWQQRPSCLRPIHCCLQGDRHFAETIANVLTSLPFIVLGFQAPRKNLNSALYANSLIGVGIASSLYHSSRGEIRKILRWADYTMIAATTLCLSRALREENPKLLMAASTMLLPIQPMMVSAVHTGMMEIAFAKRASVKPELRMAHNLHKLSSLLGGALFFADDCFPQTPYIHAAWHLAAAIGVGTCNRLLE